MVFLNRLQGLKSHVWQKWQNFINGRTSYTLQSSFGGWLIKKRNILTIQYIILKSILKLLGEETLTILFGWPYRNSNVLFSFTACKYRMENWFFMDLKMIFLAIYRNLLWFILCGYHKELGTSKSVVRTKQLRGRRMKKKKKKKDTIPSRNGLFMTILLWLILQLRKPNYQSFLTLLFAFLFF